MTIHNGYPTYRVADDDNTYPACVSCGIATGFGNVCDACTVEYPHVVSLVKSLDVARDAIASIPRRQSPRAIARYLADHREGATVDTYGTEPATGTVVATSDSLILDTVDVDAITAYVAGKGSQHWGIWTNPETGRVYVDRVKVTDRATAIAIGRARNQICVYDIDTQSDVPTGGSGENVHQSPVV